MALWLNGFRQQIANLFYVGSNPIGASRIEKRTKVITVAICYACKRELKPENENMTTDYQFDNALWIGLFGGYGMFIESKSFNQYSDKDHVIKADMEAVLCHDCAHEACEKLPWLESLIDTHNAHSHTIEYMKENPDHYGWDYDEN